MEELDKFKKKIGQLEDDIEDLEDDLDKEQKKRREAEAANAELADKLSEKDKDVEEAKKALSFAENQLSKSQNEVETVAKSMHFVSEILNAKSENDNEQSEVARLSRVVDDIVHFVTDDYVDFSERVFGYDPLHYTNEKTNEEHYLYPYLDTWACQAKKSWLRGKKSVALVGEFSAGKTSIVNRLLGQKVSDKNDKGLLYTSAKAATAVPTYVIEGVKERFLFVTKDDDLKILSKEVFTSASKEVMDKIEGLPNLVKFFIMYQRLPSLNKFSILDTPGFNSNDSADASRTMEVINECDALFWVIDVNAGTVNKSSLKVIKEGYSSSKPLYVVINKTDTKSAGEVDSVVRKVQDDFNRAGIRLTDIIRFGFKSDLAALINPISAIEKEDETDGILDYVDEGIASKVKFLQEKYIEVDKDRREWSEKIEEDLKILSGNFEAISSDAETAKDLIDVYYRSAGFWSDAAYELPKDQGEKLKHNLDDLIETTEMQKKNIGIFKEHVEANQEREQCYQDCKSDLKEAKGLKERFKKLLGEYQKLTSSIVSPPPISETVAEYSQKQNDVSYSHGTQNVYGNKSQNSASTSPSAPKREGYSSFTGYASGSSEECMVYMSDAGPKPTAVVKAIAEYSRLSKGKAKEIVNSCPSVVWDKLSEETAQNLVGKLIEAGAEASVIYHRQKSGGAILHTDDSSYSSPMRSVYGPPGSNMVYMSDAGPKPSAVVKVITAHTGLTKNGAREIVNNAPSIVLDNLSKTKAEDLVRFLNKAGAQTEVL